MPEPAYVTEEDEASAAAGRREAAEAGDILEENKNV